MDKETLKRYIKPITDGLFGKYSPYRMKEEHFVVRPISVIVEDLCKIDDEAWVKYAFSREPLNGKFDDAKRIELAEKATSCGVSICDEYTTKYGVRDPMKLAKKMNLLVDYPYIPQNTERVLFAEFKKPNKIFVYMDGVNKAERLLNKPGVKEVVTNRLKIPELLLAHELFHFIEEDQKKEIWTHKFKFDLWGLKFLHNYSSISVLSEIAAMGFAKELTGIPFSPYVMDAFMVYGYAPEAASALYEEMMKFAGLTPH
ncbi:MAG: hypothetical protein FWC47_04875 [Oscillospiraceae bacterium]|nr:hypothetical protein [Oscillospiraceae bacterium]